MARSKNTPTVNVAAKRRTTTLQDNNDGAQSNLEVTQTRVVANTSTNVPAGARRSPSQTQNQNVNNQMSVRKIPTENYLDGSRQKETNEKSGKVRRAPENDLLKQTGKKSFAKSQVVVSLGEKVTNKSLENKFNRGKQTFGKKSSDQKSKKTIPKRGQPRFTGAQIKNKSTTGDRDTVDIQPFSLGGEPNPVSSGISPGQVAFTDPDSRNKYAVLQQSGLNVLRSEIIAAIEYIPITGDDKEDTKLFQKRYSGDGGINSISIRSIGRLIELHRQIRDYILQTAIKVFERTFPTIYNKSIIEVIKIDTQTFIAQNLSTSEIITSLSKPDPVDDITSKVISFQIQNRREVRLTKMLTDMSNDNFLRGIYHCFIYESLIEEIVSYTSKITNIQKVFKKLWQIDTTKAIPINSNIAIVNAGQGSTKISSLLSKTGFSKKSEFYDPSLFSNLFGIKRSENNSDSDIIYALIGHLYGQLQFRDSTFSIKSIPTVSEDRKIVKKDEINLAISNDLNDMIKKVKDYRVVDFISGLGENTAFMRFGDFDPNRTLVKQDFYNLATKVKYKSTIQNTREEDEVFNKDIATSELLVASIYDFNINMMHTIGTNSNYRSVLPSLLLDQYMFQSDVENKYDVFANKIIMGVPVNISRDVSSLPRQNYMLGRENSPVFILDSLDATSTSNPSKKIIKLEGTKNNIDTAYAVYTPGYEYFSDNLMSAQLTKKFNTGELTSNEETAEQIYNDFSSQYYTNTIKLVNDISTLFPTYESAESSGGSTITTSATGKMSPKHRIKNLLTYLKNDLQKLLTDDSLIPLMAIFLSQGSEEDKSYRQLRTFLAIFWGYITSHKYRQLLNLPDVSSGRQTSDGYELFNESKIKISSEVVNSLSHFYNEQCLQSFLTEDCGAELDMPYDGSSQLLGGEEILFKSDEAYRANKYYLTCLDASSNIQIKNSNTFASGPAIGDINGSNILKAEYTTPLIKVKLNKAFAGGTNNTFDSLILNLNLYDKNVEISPGLFRLFEESFSAVAGNQDFSDILGRGQVNNLGTVDLDVTKNVRVIKYSTDGDLPAWSDNDDNRYKSNKGPLSLTMHQRSLVWYKWVQNFLLKTLGVTCSTSSSGFLPKLNVSLSKSQIEGVIAGLDDSINSLGQQSQSTTATNDYIFENARNQSRSIANILFRTVDYRQESFANICTAFLNHSTNIFLSSTVGTVQNSNPYSLTALLTPTPNQILAISLLKNTSANLSDGLNGIIKNTVLMANFNTANTIKASKERNFKITNTLLPEGIKFNLNKNRLMYKILSQSNYGLKSSEKRGLKTIINVGIPNGMMEVLQKNAYQRTGNPEFLDSPYVCIAIHKKNHLSNSETYCPKLFVFDTSAKILDKNPISGELSNHLSDYSDEYSLSQILDKLEITRFLPGGIDNLEQVNAQSLLGMYGINDKKILMNHLIDYCLKEYMLLTTGVSMHEETFLLDPNEEAVEPDLDPRYQEAFNKIVKTLTDTYPEVNQDPQLLNEVYRLTNVIKQMFPFSARRNYLKTAGVKKFDNVYSIIVNEKDFLLKSHKDIFTQMPNMNYGSELERPAFIDRGKVSIALRGGSSSSGQLSTTNNQSALTQIIEEALGDIFKRRSSNVNTQIESYIKSLDENSPEVYNYSVNAVILPKNFLSAPLVVSSDKSGTSGSTSAGDFLSSSGIGFN